MLWLWLQPILVSNGEGSVGDSSGLVNGLVLLKHIGLLLQHFYGQGFKGGSEDLKITSQQSREVHLLLWDFLGDSQVFQGLDCNHPYKDRIHSLSHQIARLNAGFHAVDRAEGLSKAQQPENSNGTTDKLAQPDSPVSSAIGLTLNLAAREGDEAEVKCLLDLKMNPNLSFPRMGVATPLIEAIQHGHVSIVRLLIAHGVNVNGAVEGKCRAEDQLPLLVAVRAGRSHIIRLLLDGRAAPIPLSYLSESERLRLAQLGLSQGFDPSVLFEGSHRKQVSEAARKIRRLYWEFRNKFAKMALCAQAPPAQTPHESDDQVSLGHTIASLNYTIFYITILYSLCRSPPPCYICTPWGVELCEDYSTAWDIAIGVMRELCQGKPPSSVTDTLLFLCLIQTMAVVMDDQDGPALEAQFMKDLGRWQSLFIWRSDEFASLFPLLDFQNAVASIWEVDLRSSNCAQNPDPQALTYFQCLARRPMDCADRYIDLANLEGSTLLSSQAQWRLNCNAESSHQRQSDLDQPQTSETPNRPGAFGTSGLSGSARPSMTMKGSQNYRHKVLEASMCSDLNSSPQQSVVDLLMAGAIFIIFIMFLLCMFLSPLQYSVIKLGVLTS